ncbi:MAG: ribosomal RNA small subunit methyltransferase A [Saprospiraceae bacterium]|nr:ribosomal RNA small subunit methyltransferase A [Saprospiraceae bacterium]
MKAKKHLGQHFLSDNLVLEQIFEAVENNFDKSLPVLEVGPGGGVLTGFLHKTFPEFNAVEFDRDLIDGLREQYGDDTIIQHDFLSYDTKNVFEGRPFQLVGNFPYNISSQIIFKMLEERSQIPVMVGMFQKEVAERICADPGSKKNGILSIRTQLFYKADKLFDIPPEAFDPPPRVDSSVIVCRRKNDIIDNLNHDFFNRIVKMSFGQRRKKMRNTLKGLIHTLEDPIFQKRPEELSFEDFVNISIKAQQ